MGVAMSLRTILAASAISVGMLATAAPASAASHCAMIRGSGIGATEGIARWMANKAVTDSAKKWAGEAPYRLFPVKITCSSYFSCSGAARACRR